MNPLADRVEEIQSRSDLVAFVRTLVEGFGQYPSPRNHASTSEYLEALAAWIDESDIFYGYMGEKPLTTSINWKQVGEMLLGATNYE